MVVLLEFKSPASLAGIDPVCSRLDEVKEHAQINEGSLQVVEYQYRVIHAIRIDSQPRCNTPKSISKAYKYQN